MVLLLYKFIYYIEIYIRGEGFSFPEKQSQIASVNCFFGVTLSPFFLKERDQALNPQHCGLCSSLAPGAVRRPDSYSRMLFPVYLTRVREIPG